MSVSERRSTTSCMSVLTSWRSGAAGPRGGPIRCRSTPSATRRNISCASWVRPSAAYTSPRRNSASGMMRVRGIFLDDALEALARRDRIALVQVVARDPELLLGDAAAADLDLRERVAGVAAIGIVPDEHLECGHGLLGDRLILLDGLHLVVVAHGEAVLHEVGDLMARVERQERLELLDGLLPLALAVVRLADEEPRPGRVDRLRVTLDDLLERRPRVGVAAAVQLGLAEGVEIGGGRQRLRPLPDPIGERRASSQEGEHGHEGRRNREGIETHLQGDRFQSG